MPRLTRRRLDLWRLEREFRAIWPTRDDWLRFWAVAIPILVVAIVVAVWIAYR